MLRTGSMCWRVPELIICSRLHGLYFHVLCFLFFFFMFPTPYTFRDNLDRTDWMESSHGRYGVHNLTYSSTTGTACTSSYMTSSIQIQVLPSVPLSLLRPISVFQSLSHTCHARYGTNGTRQPNTKCRSPSICNVFPLGTSLGRSSPFSGGLTGKVSGETPHSH